MGREEPKRLSWTFTDRFLGTILLSIVCTLLNPAGRNTIRRFTGKPRPRPSEVAIESSGVSPKDIGGVGLSGMSPACILVDENHKPLRPSHIWMDRRAITQSEWIKKEIGEDAIFELSANPVDPYYGITKLMWERDNAPAAYERAYKVLNPKDYPLLKLTGKAVTDYSNAALMGICFDIRRRRWDEDMVKRLGIRYDVLPELYPCDEVVGEVTAEAAQVTGLAEGTPVVAGTVDANAAWLSMGVIDDGENALTMGTAACWGVAHDDEFFCPWVDNSPPRGGV